MFAFLFNIFKIGNVSKVICHSKELLKLGRYVTQSFTLKNLKIEKDYVAMVIESCFQAKKIMFIDCIYLGDSVFDVSMVN